MFATGFRVLALGFIIATRPLENLFVLDFDLALISFTPLVVVGALFAFFSAVGGVVHFWPVSRQKLSV